MAPAIAAMLADLILEGQDRIPEGIARIARRTRALTPQSGRGRVAAAS